jgi:CRISPR-associated protein Csb2
MLVIEVQLLTGRYVAIADNRKATSDATAEWPPHPARLFSAMVAALHDRPAPWVADARTMLELLQRADAPEIEASNLDCDSGVGRRSVCEVFVPINDVGLYAEGDLARIRETSLAVERVVAELDHGNEAEQRQKLEKAIEKARKTYLSAVNKAVLMPDKPSAKDKKAVALLLDRRLNPKPRTFPCFFPDLDTIRFQWPRLSLEPPLLHALAALLDRVTRLGHSSTLVRCALATAAKPTLIPVTTGEDSDHVLRVMGQNQLTLLEEQYPIHTATRQRVLPSRPQHYRVVSEPGAANPPKYPQGHFDHRNWIVLAAEQGSGLNLTRCVDAAKALHRTLVSREPNVEFISGKAADRQATTRSHLAIVPLPDVGHDFADGHLLGIALVAPRDAALADRQTVRELLARWEMEVDAQSPKPRLRLLLAGGLEWWTYREESPTREGLKANTWCAPARRWISATPVALDRNPGNLRSRDRHTSVAAVEEARRIISAACERQGLPGVRVEISFVPLLPGSTPVTAFDPFPREENRLKRVRVHAELLFDEQVRGPILLGAGRFFGLGLFRPVEK